jgi:hypothetical protein
MHKFATVRRAAVIVLLLSVVAPLRALLRGPDGGGYTASDATVYSFIDVSSGGASVLAGTDDGTAALTLPFPFSFYGQSYALVCVSSNGAIYFVPSAASCTGVNDFANIDLALTTPNDWPALFPFWTDLTFQMPGAGSVFYQTIGASPNRRLVVQWNNALPSASANAVTFQAILSEGSNNILFQYKTVMLGAGNPESNGAHATVGIRNANGPANNTLIEWSFDAPVLHDGTAILFGNVPNDTTPPVSTASVIGAAGANGWYQGPVQVSLSATDPDSPVASTSYSIDGGALLAYAAPFTVSGNGIHHVSYFSVDPSHNQETPKQLDVKIDATAPAVTAAATPTSLWPPNGKTVNVSVSGSVTDALSGVDPSSARYSVVDSYGQVQRSGTVTVASNGYYAFTVPLVAARNDKSGRTYTITIRTADLAGNIGSAAVIVTVPHDQGK